MSRRRAPLALALCLALLPCLAQADDDLLARAASLQAAGDAAGAYALLQPQASTRAGQPDFDFALAAAALDSGNPGAAIIALQRVLAVQPDNAPARAELARAYALVGDYDTAKAAFQTVVGDPTIPDPVRRRFDNLIGDYTRKTEGGSSVTGFAEATVGHDSNVNAATSLTSITIPLFAFLGPGNLSGASRAMADSAVELQAGVTGVHAMDRQNRVFASALVNWRDNQDSKRFDQQVLTVTGGYAHTLANRDVASVSLQGQGVWLGGDALRNAYGLIGQYTHFTASGGALALVGQYHALDYAGSSIPDAGRYSLGASYSTRRWLAGGDLGRERARDSAFKASSYRFARLNGGVQAALGPRAVYFADATLEQRRHEAPDVLFLERREDARLDLQTGVKWQFRPQLQWLAKAGWTRNVSNIALYTYSRWNVFTGVRYEF